MIGLKRFISLKSAGLLAALVVLLIGTSSCKQRRYETKYGAPPPEEQIQEPIMKYGAPVDFSEED
jgi:hypothetical protein